MNGPELEELGYQFPECYFEFFTNGWPSPPGVKTFALSSSKHLVIQFHVVDEPESVLDGVRLPWDLDELAVRLRRGLL